MKRTNDRSKRALDRWVGEWMGGWMGGWESVSLSVSGGWWVVKERSVLLAVSQAVSQWLTVSE